MENSFPYSFGFKRYHTWDYHLKTKFGEKIAKIPIDGGFTCPNIDGSRGLNGCIYCSGRGSGDFAGNRLKSFQDQFEEIKKTIDSKWHAKAFIAYFQAHTNTYAPIEVLDKLYLEALMLDGVVGLAIATRADCIDEGIADLLLRISKKTYLTVELGLQTVHDSTAHLINRCHDFNDFLQGYKLLTDRGINVCIHLINGLPFETREMMKESARVVADLKPHSVKLHLLHILKDTKLSEMYERGEFEALTLDEYIQIICDQLEFFAPETIIQRVTGDGKKEELIAPLWSCRKKVVINEIDKEMIRRRSVQGIKQKK